jgi:type IV pilus assembly protein PilP
MLRANKSRSDRASLLLKKWFFSVFLAIFVVALMSCNDSGRAKIDKFIAEVKKTPASVMPPIPTVKPYHKEEYKAQGLPNPFSPAQNSARGQDTGHAKGPLERFSLDSLKMVGTITNDGQRLALIAVPDGTLYLAIVGDYMGQDHGRVMAITEKGLQVQETMRVGDTWKRREVGLILVEGTPTPASLSLAQKK